MAVTQKNVDKNFRIVGVYSSSSNYLTGVRKSAAEEGDIYYDTTLNQLRTYDGSTWSPAGLSATSVGSWDTIAQIGAKVTNVDQLEIERSYASGAIFVLDQNNAGASARCLNLENASNNAASITLDFASTNGYDIDGSSSAWYVTKTGDALFHDIWVKDDLGVQFGTGASSAGDVSVIFSEGAVGTAGKGLLFDAVAADEQIQIGDATYSFDVWFVGETATTNFMKWDIDAGENSVGALTFDNADIQLGDNDQIRFGDTPDFTIDYNNADLLIVPAADNDGIVMGTTSLGVDLKIYGATATSIFEWYSAGDRVVLHSAAASYDTAIQLDDHLGITFGEGANFATTGDGDWQMYCSGATNNPLTLIPTTDDSIFVIGNSGGTKNADLYWYTETAGKGLFIDASADLVYLSGADLRFADDDYILLGGSATAGGTTDGTIRWDNSNSTIEVVGATLFEDDVSIGESGATNDLTIYGDLTISGTLTHSGAYTPTNIVFSDSNYVGFGTDTDYKISTAGSTAALIITAVNANDCVTIGDGTVATDFKIDNITTADADIWFDQSADTAAGTLYIGKDNKGIDVKFFGETASAYMLWDMSADQLLLSGGATIDLQDDVELLIGTGTANAGDYKLYGDSTPKLYLKEVSAAGTAFEIGQDNKGIDLKLFGESASSYCLWDQSGDEMIFDGADLWLKDDDQLEFGDASDVVINWDHTNLLIEAAADNTGQIRIGSTNAMDLAVYGSTASKIFLFDVDTAIVEIDDWDVNLQDDDFLYFGDSNDISINWDGTQLMIDGAAEGTGIIIGATNSQDLTITGDNTNDTIYWDTTAEDVRFNGWDLTLQDDDVLNFGDGDDITITWDGTNLLIDGASEGTGIKIGSTNSQDLTIAGDTATDTVYWDTTAEDMRLDGWDLTLQKADILNFGDGDNVTMTYDGTTMQIDGAAADTPLHLGDTTTGFDLTYYFEGANLTIATDYDADVLTFSDAVSLAFGSSKDVTINWDATDLHIDALAADSVINIGYTNNLDLLINGDNTNQSVLYDTSEEDVRFNGFDLTIMDSDIVNFGDSDDVTITWDATDLHIDALAADTKIQIGFTNNLDLYIYGDNTNQVITFDTSAESCAFDGFDLTMQDDDIIKFGDAGAESTIASDGTNTNWTVASGTIDIGDGGTTNYTSFDSTGDITQVGSAQFSAFRRKVTAKTGDYSLLATDSGGVFTNYGAGAGINFTLPSKVTGLNYTIIVAADQNVTVTADAADTMVCFNDAACDTVAYSTAGDLLGGAFYVITDGNLWYVIPWNYADGVNVQTVSQTT